MSARSTLYAAARLLGDINAVKRGRGWERLANRLMGKMAGRIMGRLWR